MTVIAWLLDHMGVPAIVGLLWLIRRLEKVWTEVYGPHDANGLRGDVKELRSWRETMPKQFEETRHLLRNEFQGDLGELELRVRALERQR